MRYIGKPNSLLCRKYSQKSSLLRDDTYTVAIITRPPEIVALFNIPSGDTETPYIPILFDSHPRPDLHPKGAAFIVFLNEEGAIEYLSSLFQTDEALLESQTWDASLLGQYTAHILKLKLPTPAETDLAFYQANIRILMEQAKLRESTTREAALSAEVASLRGRIAFQLQQIDRAIAEETASREELILLRHEVERLKRAAAHEQWSGSWVDVPWRSGTPPRGPLMYANQSRSPMNRTDCFSEPHTTTNQASRCKMVPRSKLRFAKATTVPRAIAYPHLCLISGSVSLS